MPIGFNVRFMPGVRISASSRSIRAGLGPRIARVNVGSRGTSLSTGVGPFFASTGTGRRRKSSSSLQHSLKAYEREMRRAQKEQEIAQVAKLEQQLVLAHLEEFPVAQPQEAPAPTPVDRPAILRNCKKEALSGISLFAWSTRRTAKREAAERAEQVIQEEERLRIEARAKEQSQLDAAWHLLTTNDPQAVFAALDEAFEDNQVPAAPINCEGGETTIMVLYDSPNLVPDQKPALTPSGNLTLRKRNKTERNELYAVSLASSVLVTAKEAFAIAPGTERLVTMVVRKDELPAPAQPGLSCLYCGRFERSRFEQLDWTSVNPLEEISHTPGALIERKGRTAEVSPLNLSDAPDLAAVLRTTADMLGGEANVGSARRRRR